MVYSCLIHCSSWKACVTSKLVNYADRLPVEARCWYRDKLLELINGVDPLCISAKGGYEPASSLPPMDAGGPVSYLFLHTSYITAKQFKAHKSMEAYNQFVSGWVKDVLVNGKFVVVGKVKCIGMTK